MSVESWFSPLLARRCELVSRMFSAGWLYATLLHLLSLSGPSAVDSAHWLGRPSVPGTAGWGEAGSESVPHIHAEGRLN